MNETILITGGSGTIGLRWIEFAIDKYKIIAVGTSYAKFPEKIRFHKNFKFYERNLQKWESIEDIQIPENIDLIWHMAALVSGSKASEEEYYKTNVKATELLVRFAERKQVKGFGFLSSVSVYGVTEKSLQWDSPRNGYTLYAKTKTLAEDFLLRKGKGYSVFRVASVFGEGTKSFITKLFALAKKRIYPSFTTDRRKSILHISDLLLAIDHWTEKVLRGDRVRSVYVLSHPESVTVTEVLNLGKELGKIPSFLFPIWIGGKFAYLWNFLFRLLAFLRRKPYHQSPLLPLLESIEIFDSSSWENLGVFPQKNLRKGVSPPQ